MAYVPTPLFENVKRRKRKATYSILNTAKDFEDAQRRVQNNNPRYRAYGWRNGVATGTHSGGAS